LVYESSILIWLLQPKSDKFRTGEDVNALWSKLLTFVKGNLELVQDTCKEVVDVSVSFALDDSPAKWEEVAERFEILKMLQNYRIGQGAGMLITDKNIVDKDMNQFTNKSIDKILQYINDNISEDLSLVRLSELVYFNPSYLSRLFKQVVGDNLSDYICKAKIRKAKQLLESPDTKIHEVASAMGYYSTTNFARFFKKLTNMTPQEYRDMFQNK
jgi:two-component system response regulator YesN